MPLLRGLRILQQQEQTHGSNAWWAKWPSDRGRQLADRGPVHAPEGFQPAVCESGSRREVGGALEITLRRLAELMEKAQKIKGKVKAAMFYPVAVIIVAMAILTLMMVYVVPRFRVCSRG